MPLYTWFMLGFDWDQKKYSLNWDFTVTRIQYTNNRIPWHYPVSG